MCTNLRNNFRVRVQLQETSGKLGSGSVVVRLCKDINGAAERDLHMRCLQCAVREVRCEFQAPLHIVRVVLSYASSLELNRHSKKVLASGCNGISPLRLRHVSIEQGINQEM